MVSKIEVKGYADGVPVYCAHDEVVAIEDVHSEPEKSEYASAGTVKKAGRDYQRGGLA